jgi:hypothetical protein
VTLAALTIAARAFGWIVLAVAVLLLVVTTPRNGRR